MMEKVEKFAMGQDFLGFSPGKKANGQQVEEIKKGELDGLDNSDEMQKHHLIWYLNSYMFAFKIFM